MKPLYIFDIDGTLALIDHRKHILDEKEDKDRWRRFYAACGGDLPNTPVIRVMEALRRFADVWLFSGRSDEVREQTVDWIVANTSFSPGELDTALQMRSEGDFTGDDDLKQQWLHSMLVDDRSRLAGVFDDRDRVVAMWRANGVPCFQVAPGAF